MFFVLEEAVGTKPPWEKWVNEGDMEANNVCEFQFKALRMGTILTIS